LFEKEFQQIFGVELGKFGAQLLLGPLDQPLDLFDQSDTA
jgi:hypothetical protein